MSSQRAGPGHDIDELEISNDTGSECGSVRGNGGMAVSQAGVRMAIMVSVDLEVLEGLATVERFPCLDWWIVCDMVPCV
jgi:hypothetical protein